MIIILFKKISIKNIHKDINRKFTTPTQRMEQKKELPPPNINWILINILHVVILAPLIIYFGISKNKAIKELIILMAMLLLFSMYFHIQKLMKKNNSISIGHIITGIFGILYLYFINIKYPVWIYYILIIIGSYIGAKHLYHLINDNYKYFIN